MDEIIVSIVERLGYFGIAVLMALENIFPPLPSEAIMGAGALAIENGSMSFWPLLIFATIGTVAGNYGWFWFGMFLCGILAPAERVTALESGVITQGWHLSLLSVLFGLPVLVLYWWRMRRP